MTLDIEEIHVVWAALCAMVEEIHQPQDNLTPEQWEIAEKLFIELNSLMDNYE